MVGDVLVVGDGRGHAPARRLVSLLVAMALLAAMLLMVADRAEAATSSTPAAAAVVVPAGAPAQFSISAIVCPILLFLRAAFGPFFSGIFDSLLAAFGCINVSPGGPINDDD